MKPRDGFDIDEVSFARSLKSRMQGLEPFVPPVPDMAALQARQKEPRARLSNGRRMVASAALLGCLALIAALAVWAPRQLTPSAGPSVSPSATIPIVARATPSIEASRAPFDVLFGGDVYAAIWSPDSTKVAIVGFANCVSDGCEEPQISIVSLQGQVLQTVTGWQLAWIDGSTFLVLRDIGQPNRHDQGSHAFTGHLGSQVLSQIPGTFEGLVGGPGGAAALLLLESGSNGYGIWSATTGLSARREGMPLLFSPDGRLLAVEHNFVGCCVLPAGVTAPPGPPKLDVTDVESGKSLFVSTRLATGGLLATPIAFSPDSRRLAFNYTSRSQNAPDRIAIVDMATRELWTAEAVGDFMLGWDELQWLDGEHLNISTWKAATSSAGLPVSLTFGPQDANQVEASFQGGLVAAYADPGRVELIEGAASTTLLVAERVDWFYLSPDGSMAAVHVGVDQGRQSELVLVRLRS